MSSALKKASMAMVLVWLGVSAQGALLQRVEPFEGQASDGFENVATYINSGNAVVRSGLSRDKVIAEVARIAKEKFGFAKAIHAPTLEEWSKLIANNPFPDAVSIPKFLHAAILEEVPQDKNVAAIRAYMAQQARQLRDSQAAARPAAARPQG